MLENVLQYYGLDWGGLCFGLVGCHLTSLKRREGFILSVIGCVCGLAVAMMSQQMGFIVYNFIIIFMLGRGYVNWGRIGSAQVA